MKISALDTLAAVLSRGSFAAGAQQVGLTPSAVSLQMGQLEAYFGQPLFDRSGRTARATAFARELCTAVNQALAVVESFRLTPVLSVTGVLRIGAIPSVQTSVLPKALRLMQVAHPELRIQLTLDVSAPLLAALNAGRIDAAITVRAKPGGSSRLAWRNLVREPFVLLAPTNSTGRNPTQVLKDHPWIRYDTALTGGRIAARFVTGLCPNVRPRFSVASTDAIVAMVSEGLGVSVIPRPRLPLRNAYGVREFSLGSAGPARQISLVCRKTDAENPRIAAMYSALDEGYRELEARRSA